MITDMFTGERLDVKVQTEREVELSRVNRDSVNMRAYLEPTLTAFGDTCELFVEPDGEKLVREAEAALATRSISLREQHRKRPVVIPSLIAFALFMFVAAMMTGNWPYPTALFVMVVVCCAIGIMPAVRYKRELPILSLADQMKMPRLPRPDSLGALLSNGGDIVLAASHVAVGAKGLAFKWEPTGATYVPLARVIGVSCDLATSSVRITLVYSDKLASRMAVVTLVVSYPTCQGLKAEGYRMEKVIAEKIAAVAAKGVV